MTKPKATKVPVKKDIEAALREALKDTSERLARAEEELEKIKNLSEQTTQQAHEGNPSLTAAETLAFQRDRLADHNTRMKAFIRECIATAGFNSTKAAEVLKP